MIDFKVLALEVGRAASRADNVPSIRRMRYKSRDIRNKLHLCHAGAFGRDFVPSGSIRYVTRPNRLPAGRHIARSSSGAVPGRRKSRPTARTSNAPLFTKRIARLGLKRSIPRIPARRQAAASPTTDPPRARGCGCGPHRDVHVWFRATHVPGLKALFQFLGKAGWCAYRLPGDLTSGDACACSTLCRRCTSGGGVNY